MPAAGARSCAASSSAVPAIAFGKPIALRRGARGATIATAAVRASVAVARPAPARAAAAAADTLRQIKGLGVRLAIDDFGTGYASLAYLKRFPFDVLKIDRAFVAGLGRDPADAALVGAIVTLAHALGLAVVAEGVETADHAARLRELGCDCGQGFHFARPLPPDAATALLGAGGHIAGATPATPHQATAGVAPRRGEPGRPARASAARP